MPENQHASTDYSILIHDAAQAEAGGAAWLQFANPHCIICAKELNEVLPALKEIEQLVNEKNWYAAGFISYEAAPAFDNALNARLAPNFPLVWFGLYSAPQRSAELPYEHGSYNLGEWTASVSRETYNAAIAQVKERIARGRTYQVNYTFRLRNNFSGSAPALFGDMVKAQAPGYSAYMDTGETLICSASPELFFRMEGNIITCRPMKGTVKRGRWLKDDEAQATWLQASSKNRAENVMIVDMIRNDLGRLAEIGSVRVPELFSAERYGTLWQMTSSVSAEIRAPFVELLQALFPCASITGAPKVSTMQIISELESSPRRLYTGAIGYLAPQRHAQFSVAIRTLIVEKASGQAEYGVGGGIVWDSTSKDEYAEALLKARVLTESHPEFALIETLRWDPNPDIGYTLFDEHLRRLAESAAYFAYPFESSRIEAYLADIAKELGGSSPQRIRLLLNRNGSISHQNFALIENSPAVPMRLRLAKSAINSQNTFLYHKTTRREVYEQARGAQPDCDDVLLFNERGELTESTIANLVVERDGALYTPPLACGLLPGTLRSALLTKGQILERVILVADLAHCTKIFLINSVRGWMDAELLT